MTQSLSPEALRTFVLGTRRKGSEPLTKNKIDKFNYLIFNIMMTENGVKKTVKNWMKDGFVMIETIAGTGLGQGEMVKEGEPEVL